MPTTLIRITADRRLYVGRNTRIHHGPPCALLALAGAIAVYLGVYGFLDDLHDYPWPLRDHDTPPHAHR